MNNAGYQLGDLSEEDLAVCKMWAALRTTSNRRHKIGRPFSTGFESHLNNEEAGVKAEYAFCKHHNIFFNGAFGGKDNGVDCVLNGKRIDIKSITSSDKNLVTHGHTDKSNVDVYVLVYVYGAKASIVGWIEKDTFIKDENLRDLGHGVNSYFMESGRLNKWRKA